MKPSEIPDGKRSCLRNSLSSFRRFASLGVLFEAAF